MAKTKTEAEQFFDRSLVDWQEAGFHERWYLEIDG